MPSSKVKIEVTGAIFTLPYYVAQEEGYFADEGLDVELVPSFGNHTFERPESLVADPGIISSFDHFTLFEQGDSALYRACEWGQIRRSHDSANHGRVAGKRAAVPSQAVIVHADSGFTTPQSLRNRLVGVNFHHGSHYVAIKTLEGFVRRDEIKVVHAGGPRERLDALLEGRIDAAVLMEPWITIADKLGLVNVAESHYYGTEIAGPQMAPETFAAINRAISRAVRTINADLRAYLPYFVREVPDDLGITVTADDFRTSRLRYVEPEPYSEEEFERTYAWMVSWDLIPADARFEDLIDNKVTTA